MRTIFRGGLTGTLSALRTITQKNYQAHQSHASKTEPAKKIIEKEENFRQPKSVLQKPRFTTQFTTTSPRFTIIKHHEIAQTPCKNASPPQKQFLPNPQAQNSTG
jgi:hypothetical protein